jgi:hypothetical protein
MKNILIVVALMVGLAACSQHTLPSRHPNYLPSRYPVMLPSRAYQKPKVNVRGEKVIIVMSKQQYLEMERRRNQRFASPRFKH